MSIWRYGDFGVDVFFGLSGLLITKLLLAEFERTGSFHLDRFYVRRAFRILPPTSWALTRRRPCGGLVGKLLPTSSFFGTRTRLRRGRRHPASLVACRRGAFLSALAGFTRLDRSPPLQGLGDPPGAIGRIVANGGIANGHSVIL